MSEKLFSLESYSPVEIYGINDRNLNVLRELFPKLRIVARDEIIRANGDDPEIESFEQILKILMIHYDKFGSINENDIRLLMENGRSTEPTPAKETNEDILVHGRNGMMIKARTINQERIVKSIATNDMVFAIGPAGTGKTYTAVALAVRALKNKEVRRIILTRPAVEAGENLGFLPGDLKDKLDPYLQPLYDALYDMLPAQKLLSYLEDRTIEIAPLAFMRGRTLDHVFAILDEAQNATPMQLKMFLTRMGKSSKFFITGDITQVDLPRNQASGLIQSVGLLKDIPGIDFIMLDTRDVVRHKLVTSIINAYEKNDQDKTQGEPKNKWQQGDKALGQYGE
jgi:phosphate starvation-inducible protein PhoH and related proteins